MATFLDIAVLNNFSNIFVVIFVFAAVYAILTVKHPFGDNKGINSILAFAVSFLFFFSEDAIKIVKAAVPWWTLMIILLVFMIILKESFGASWVKGFDQTMGTIILVVALIIFIFAWGGAVGQKVGPYLNSSSTPTGVTGIASSATSGGTNVASGSFQENLGATLFNPKVLGLILIIVIALFAVLFITYPITVA